MLPGYDDCIACWPSSS